MGGESGTRWCFGEENHLAACLGGAVAGRKGGRGPGPGRSRKRRRAEREAEPRGAPRWTGAGRYLPAEPDRSSRRAARSERKAGGFLGEVVRPEPAADEDRHIVPGAPELKGTGEGRHEPRAARTLAAALHLAPSR